MIGGELVLLALTGEQALLVACQYLLAANLALWLVG